MNYIYFGVAGVYPLPLIVFAIQPIHLNGAEIADHKFPAGSAAILDHAPARCLNPNIPAQTARAVDAQIGFNTPIAPSTLATTP